MSKFGRDSGMDRAILKLVNNATRMSTSESSAPRDHGIEQVLSTVEDYVRREPVKASAVAFGAGLLLKLLPARAVARPVATLAVKLLPPVLVGLGLLKALEICCPHESARPANEPPVESP